MARRKRLESTGLPGIKVGFHLETNIMIISQTDLLRTGNISVLLNFRAIKVWLEIQVPLVLRYQVCI